MKLSILFIGLRIRKITHVKTSNPFCFPKFLLNIKEQIIYQLAFHVRRHRRIFVLKVVWRSRRCILHIDFFIKSGIDHQFEKYFDMENGMNSRWMVGTWVTWCQQAASLQSENSVPVNLFQSHDVWFLSESLNTLLDWRNLSLLRQDFFHQVLWNEDNLFLQNSF